MRRIVYAILSLYAVACSSEIDEATFEEVNIAVNINGNYEGNPKENTTLESDNDKLVLKENSFAIAEHSVAGSSIGFLTAGDTNEQQITYALASDADIDIDENTGELKVGANLTLDFEQAETIEFSISAFDGKTITEKIISLDIQDVDEMALLTDEQKELISYFKYLTLWKGPFVSEVDTNRKWTTPMILYFDGNITDGYRATIEKVISQYNALFREGDFRITLTENRDDANAHLFFGEKEEVAGVWPDMYNTIKNDNYSGYAKTPSQNSTMTSTRIWISNPIEALLVHELGHALGLGHSNQCDSKKKSIMCSTVNANSSILPIEAEVIRYQYHRDFPSGLSEREIEKVLANLILNEQ